MLRNLLPARLRPVALLSLVFLSAAFYLILSNSTKASVKEQLIHRELTIAKAIASNLQSTFEVIGNSTAFRAQLTNKEDKGEALIRDMNVFVDQWRDSGLISGIVLTDSKGVVRFSANVSDVSGVGTDISDRDYFLWAKTQTEEGSFYVGQPVVSRLGASEGQMIIPVASPVISDGVFTGVYATAMKLNPLAKRFIEVIKISGQTEVFILDQNRNILYSSTVSEDLSENVKKGLDFDKDGVFQDGDKLIAYSPLKLGEQRWLTVVSSPLKEVLNLSLPFYVRQVAALVLVSIITLIFGIIAYREGQNKLK